MFEMFGTFWSLLTVNLQSLLSLSLTGKAASDKVYGEFITENGDAINTARAAIEAFDAKASPPPKPPVKK